MIRLASSPNCASAALALLLGVLTSAFGQSVNQVLTVSPATAAQGATGLLVTFTLDADAPPAPPAGVLPLSVTLGNLNGASVTHASPYVVTAVFDIPPTEILGAREAAIVFTTPQGTLTFSRSDAFSVTAGGETAPSITQQPQSRTLAPGSFVSISVSASGTAPLAYRWQKQTLDLPAGTNAAYAIASATEGDAGDYRCVVTNAHGAVTSAVATLIITTNAALVVNDYGVVDTAQVDAYDTNGPITPPPPGQPFSGQDAQYAGRPPSYALSGDGLTVQDQNTGLTWQQTPDTDRDGDIDASDKLTWAELQSYPGSLNATNHGGHSDWRLPSIKELYSLMDFRGTDPSGYSGSDTSGLVPFIDTRYFAFGYGDTGSGERLIDAQFASDTLYVATTGGGDLTLFGVNFADGRIKGYGLNAPGGGDKAFYVICCRGNPDYGINQYVDNGDGTVTDQATGLMWQQADSGTGRNWEAALAYAENLELAGYRDWRLPNAKELQGILDYTRSPATTGSAAIDPVFGCTSITNEAGAADYPAYWTSTTHANWTADSGRWAACVCFGRALGYMNNTWVDVHGAGAQRSDPKFDDGTDYSSGHGPQGDAVRIDNHVRCVRAGATPPATDTDADGLTDWYEWDYTSNPTNMVAAADGDADGASNREEQAAGTIPTDADSVLHLIGLSATMSGLRLNWASEPSQVYTVEYSTNLAEPAWTTIASGLRATPPSNTYTHDSMNSAAAFYRVSVE